MRELPEDNTSAAGRWGGPPHLYLALGHGAGVDDHVGTAGAELGEGVTVQLERADRARGDVTGRQGPHGYVVLGLHHEHETRELGRHLAMVTEALEAY